MGGFCGVAQSAAQGVQSVTQDPAVATTGTQYPAKVTYNASGNTKGTSPKPPKKPTALEKKVYDVTGNIAKDLHMGFSTLFQSKEKQAETLKAKGYSDDVIADYQARTAASQERMRQSMMSSGGDDNDSSPAPAPVSAPAPAPTPAPTTPTPTPPPAPAPISEDTSAPEEGSAEAEVIASAERRRGRASTIETTPQGLITAAKTAKKKSLMNKMIA